MPVQLEPIDWIFLCLCILILLISAVLFALRFFHKGMPSGSSSRAMQIEKDEEEDKEEDEDGEQNQRE